MDALDDVVALAELSQRVLCILGQRPLGGAKSISKTQRFELAHPADLDGLEFSLQLATLRT